MTQRTQFWFSILLLGVFTLAALFGAETAAVGAFVYAGLLGAGIFFVKVALRRWSN